MGMIASQITSLTIVYSTVYSGAYQRKIKGPRHWPLRGEFTGDQWIPRTNGQLREKCFHLMTSSWYIISLNSPTAALFVELTVVHMTENILKKTSLIISVLAGDFAGKVQRYLMIIDL